MREKLKNTKEPAWQIHHDACLFFWSTAGTQEACDGIIVSVKRIKNPNGSVEYRIKFYNVEAGINFDTDKADKTISGYRKYN